MLHNYEVYGFDSSIDKPGNHTNSLKAVLSPSPFEEEKLAEFLIDFKNKNC